MEDQQQNKQHSPYWSAKDRNCTFRKGGLFIPLEDHIDIYCTTEKHTNCLQYRLVTSSHFPPSEVDTAANRRKYSRVNKKLPLTLVLLNKSGNVVRQFKGTYDTVDLSLGGMQLCTNEPLLDDTIISFSFGESYPKTLQSGIARVKWCKYREKKPNFSAGLAFQTDDTADAIRSCFNISPN